MGDLERIVVASVAITARVLAEVAPDLTFLQWRAIVVIDQAIDGIAVGALATELGARLAATSRLVGRLRAHELVSTAKDSVDARVTIVRLSGEGVSLRTAVVDRRRSTLASAVEQGRLATTDLATASRIAVALEGAR